MDRGATKVSGRVPRPAHLDALPLLPAEIEAPFRAAAEKGPAAVWRTYFEHAGRTPGDVRRQDWLLMLLEQYVGWPAVSRAMTDRAARAELARQTGHPRVTELLDGLWRRCNR